MAKVRIELNKNAVRELLQSQEMLNACSDFANRAVTMLGDGYEVTTLVGKTRVNAEIAAVSDAARSENLKSNSILKALEAVRE